MKKSKIIFLTSILLMAFLCFVACGDKSKDDNKITIVTTLFPQYDFARQMVGGKCEVKLLLTPGTEAHSYEPTPQDIIDINDAELFIYTGDAMEAWARTILDGIDNKELKVLDMSNEIELLETGDAEHEHSHEGHEEEHEEHEDEVFGHAHSHDIDPHFFTSPKNAIVMMNNILEAIIDIDSENEEYYRQNCESYVNELKKVDERLHEIVHKAQTDTIYFGGKFALLYFVNEYELSYVSPFDSCSHEAEANPKDIVDIIECMKEHGATTVFYEELTDPKVANIIADEVDGKALLLHSCHNVSKEDIENNVTYVDLMNQNADNLEKGLK